MVIGVALPRAAAAVLPLNADQGLYITAGEVLKRGGLVGRDTWDNKPPGTYYLYAALLKFAPDYSVDCTVSVPRVAPNGVHVPCAQMPLTAFDALYALALSVAVWWIAARMFGAAAGAIAGLLCAVFISMMNVMHGGAIPDVFVLLPTTLAYAGALRYAETDRRWWLLVAGVLGGLGLLFKQNAIVLLAGIGVWAVIRALRCRERWRGAVAAGAMLTAGFLVVVGVVAVVLAAMGALGDVVNQTIVFNRYYAGSPNNVNNFFSQLRTQTWNVFTDSQSALWIAALGALPLLQRPDQRVWLLATWVVTSALSILLGGAHLLVYYYLTLVPPLAVCGGWALTRLWSRTVWTSRVWLVACSLTLFVYANQFQAAEYGRALYGRIQSTTHDPEEFVAGSIKGGGGTIFVWGNGSQVYALSGRTPASRYLHTLALSNDFAFHPQVGPNRAEVMATLRAAPPAVIVVDTPWLKKNNTLEFPELRDFLASEYTLSNAPSNPIFNGWEIYHHND